jgi:hypothetical protein
MIHPLEQVCVREKGERGNNGEKEATEQAVSPVWSDADAPADAQMKECFHKRRQVYDCSGRPIHP